jgi:hypothetical protein
MALALHRHRLLGLLFADPQVPRHAVHHDPLRAMGPRRAPGRQALNGLAKSFDQIRARALGHHILLTRDAGAGELLPR